MLLNLQDLCDECPEAQALFDKANEIVGYDLLAVCTEGAHLCLWRLTATSEQIANCALT